MPLNYKLLDKCGTTADRLREIFTASPNKLKPDATDAEREENRKDVAVRKSLEDLIASRIDESILRNLRSSHMIAAVDLAWDSAIITRKTIPLVMYAQGRIDQQHCAKSLSDLKCADAYVKKSPKGEVSIDLPKFSQVNVNMMRSVISRRVAAQSARYSNLYPFFRYDSRGTDEVSKLRSDLMSQRADIMADQFGYREQQVQWIRDMLLYPYCMVFPACQWQREVEWYDENDSTDESFKSDETRFQSRVKREGVPFISPHPSRCFFDHAYPVQSINTDTGCEWFGFWDVVRYGSILDNPDYFNRGEISYGQKGSEWFTSFASYFSQYYTVINPPVSADELSAYNDAKDTFDRYTAAMRDSSVYQIHFYLKLVPNQWRMGDYPWPIWIHLTVANSRTVIHAEIMPDTPGFVFAYNTSAQRQVNLSMAHELLPFQDQLTNLFSQLLECAKRDLFGVALLNLDAFPVENPESKKLLDDFRAAMRSENFYAATSILEVSMTKMKELGVDMANIFTIIRQPPNTQLSVIINAISQTLMMAERVMAMSPQEQAQLSPRETSATEVQVIAGTTENVYQFVSDAIDNGRAAMKRYLYNSLMSFSSNEVKLPVISRYRRDTIAKAGFTVEDISAIDSQPNGFSVIGNKSSLVGEYIFTTRDGAERASNVQSAQTLVQMLGVLMQPAILGMITKEQMSDLVNIILRQSGAGVDVVIEPPPGEENQSVLAPAQPMPQQIPTGSAQGSPVPPAEAMAPVELPKQ